jgi:hypothetical protein
MKSWCVDASAWSVVIAGTPSNHRNNPYHNTDFNGLMGKLLVLNPTAKARRLRNRTLNIRVTDEEISMARQLGNGNASHGYRLAIRYMSERSISGIPLSTMLRAAAEMAAELERSPKRGAPPTTR